MGKYHALYLVFNGVAWGKLVAVGGCPFKVSRSAISMLFVRAAIPYVYST